MRTPLVGVVLALTAAFGIGTLMARAETSGAGLVVRHGDGRVVYRYVQFSESSISGLELLKRSGLSVVSAPYPGLGEAVCAIDGEGCPAEDCFCKSYGSPSFYWNYYYIGGSGQWVRSNVGAASRRVSDGGVDGWSWTSGPPGLPATSIEEIAAMFGISRTPAASPQPTPPPSPTPRLFPTPTPSVSHATPTTVPRVQPSPSPSATPVALPTATAAPSPEMAPSPTVQVPPQGPGLATATLAVPSPSPRASPTVIPKAVSGSSGAYAAFGVLVGLIVALIGAIWWRSRLG